MTKIDVYDSGPDRGMDRYTVVIDNEDIFAMSASPLGPMGFNQYVGGLSSDRYDRRHFGRRIKYETLPEDVKKAIQMRIEAD